MGSEFVYRIVGQLSVGLPQVRKWPGKKKNLQGQGKVRKLYFESGKID